MAMFQMASTASGRSSTARSISARTPNPAAAAGEGKSRAEPVRGGEGRERPLSVDKVTKDGQLRLPSSGPSARTPMLTLRLVIVRIMSYRVGIITYHIGVYIL
mgnify:CR=1 FL=1